MTKNFYIHTICILAAIMNVIAMEQPFAEPWHLSQQTKGFTVDTAENVELVGITPGSCLAVAVDGNTAYIGAGVYLLILDIADKNEPVLLSSVQLPNIVRGVAAAGGYAYVADGSSGLRVIDVGNPENPMERAVYNTPGNAYSVAISDGLAYVADYDAGLRVIDVSNPDKPMELGFYDTPGYAYSVAISDGLTYVADYDAGLRIIDINEPQNPIEKGFYDMSGDARDVAVEGEYAYVACGGAGLRVVDVSNSEKPIGRGVYDVVSEGCGEEASGVAIEDGYVYLADGWWDLRVIDVSNPDKPMEKGSYDTPGFAQGVVVKGGYAYVADRYRGLRIIDVSNPEKPTENGAYDTPGDTRDVAVSGGYAYVVEGRGGLRIMDVSNPDKPMEKGSYDTPGYAQSVAVKGGYAYVAAHYDGGLRIIDVSNPEKPIEEGFYDTPGDAVGIAVEGGYAYVADGWKGLRIIDVSNPEKPTEKGFYDTPGGDTESVTVEGGYVYVANGDGGLRILDVSNPEKPIEKGGYNTPGVARDVAVSGGLAYVVEGRAGFRILDVSNPEKTIEKGSYDALGYAGGVAVEGGYAYVADSWAGLRVIDVSNPEKPMEKGFYDTPGGEEGVVVANDLIFLPDGAAGMSILRFTAAQLSVSFISPFIAPGAGGTKIMIYGTNFKAGATVTIGGNDAINPVVDAIASMFITAITPPGRLGSVDVVVTNPDGESATLEGGFKYTSYTGVLSADGKVSAHNAELILQYVVGLIPEFPVDQLISPSDLTPQDYELRLPNLTAKAGEQINVPLQLDEVSGLFAGGVTIKYDANMLRALNVKPSLSEAYYEVNISRPGEIRFAFAAEKLVKSVSELLMMEFHVIPNNGGKISQLIISDAQFSESLSITKYNGSIEILPVKTALLPNYPNPFNPETWIPYQLSAESYVTIEICDIHGQLVQVFDLGMRPAGSYLAKDRAVYWNGRNKCGEWVASGVYFYRLKAEHKEAGIFSAIRRLVVVK